MKKKLSYQIKVQISHIVRRFCSKSSLVGFGCALWALSTSSEGRARLAIFFFLPTTVLKNDTIVVESSCTDVDCQKPPLQFGFKLNCTTYQYLVISRMQL